MKKRFSKIILIWVSVFICSTGVHSQSTPVVFVSRNLEHGGNQYYQQAGLLPGMGTFSRFKVVGGRLLVRDSNGNIRVLIDSTMNFGGIKLIDVSDPCVYWDASKIVFAGIESRDSSWRIYEINSDGSNFKKITFTNRNINLSQFGAASSKFVKYDDIDPCYLPDGRICFASTRYPSLSLLGGMRTTNIYIVNPDGTSLHRITTERNSAEEPSIDPNTGKIVFSRWWVNIDMPSHLTSNGITRDSNLALTNDIGNLWWAASIRPDGAEMGFYGGDVSSRDGMHTYKPFVMNDGKLLSVYVPHTAMLNTSGSTGIRWFSPGPGFQNHVVGVNMNNMQYYVSNPPSYGTMQPPYATDPVYLSEGKILFSFASQVENLDFGLYTINLDRTGLQTFYDIPGKLELNAEVLLPKPIPPVLTDVITDFSDELPPTNDPNTFYKNGSFRFDCGNIFTNADVDVPVTDAPPITRNARIKLFLNFQRTDSTGKDEPILFINEPIQFAGGFWIPYVPADIPVFDQVADSTGKVIAGNRGQIAHLSGLNFGRPGTGTQCVGCHQGHSYIPPANNNYEVQFFNTSTSATVTQSSFRYVNDTVKFPGSRVKDRKARNDSLSVNWIAAGSDNEWINLKWEIPIDIRKFILYNIRPNSLNGTNIQVNDCEIILYRAGVNVVNIQSTGVISTNGTQIQIPEITRIDEAKIIIKDFSGTITGLNVAGLAEVVTDARISYYELSGIENTSNTAEKFELNQNYPNPFNPVTNINFVIPSEAFVKLVIYDLLGREIKILINKQLTAGSYNIEWNATEFSSGIYFCRIEAQQTGSRSHLFVDTRKMALIR